VFHLYRAAFSGLPRDVWVLSAAALVNRAGTMVLPFLSLYLTQERGYSAAQAGLLITTYGLGSVGGSYLGGWLSDRVGSVRTQVVSLVGTGLGYLWLMRLGDRAEIAVALFLTSLVSEAFRPAVMAATAERSPEHVQARSFALLRQAVNLGMAIGPPVGGFLALRSYAWIFIADALTCWVAAAVLALTLTRAVPAPPPRGGHVHRRPPWRDGPFLWLMLLVFVMAVAFFQLFTTVPLYFRDAYGLRENAIGLLLGLNAVLILIFEMVLTHWAESRNRLLLVGLGLFLVCAGLGIMPLGTSVAFAALTVAVWTFGEMLSLPLINAVVAGRAGPAHRGRYMGVYTMAFSLAMIVAPGGGAWVYDNLGPDVLWLGIGILAVPLLVGAVALIGPFRHRPEPPLDRSGTDVPVAR
jgi:predicted MFS family arabinose efflux permease